jgi:hypothetical protein
MNHQGDLPGYGRVWYCPSAIANILSLHNVNNRCWVAYDSRQGNQFIVTKPDGQERVFSVSDNGLYYFDTAVTAWASTTLVNTVLVNTVSENKKRYTNAEVSRAEVARKLQRTIGRPTTREFIRIVNNNLPSAQLPSHLARHPRCGRHFWSRCWQSQRKNCPS